MAGLLHVTERMREHTDGMKQIRVELINTGTEILLGSIVNTNAAWLGNRLFEPDSVWRGRPWFPTAMPLTRP